MPVDTNDDDINNLIEALDTDHNGKIQYNEFMAGAINRDLSLNDDKIRELFQHLDKVL
jgi:Ca2+-binding EF-hand superfamily protein